MTANMTPSQAFIDESKAWEDLSSMMDELVSNSKAAADKLHQNFHIGAALIENATIDKESLHTRAKEISSSIQTQIEVETNAFENESNELATQIRTVQSLEEQLSNETKHSAEIANEQRKIHQSILSYQKEAASEVNAIEENDYNHKKALKKNSREISMYADMTNIKWDYSKTNVLAGEVALPKRFEHRRFCVEKDLGEVEIAEKLWGIIDG